MCDELVADGLEGDGEKGRVRRISVSGGGRVPLGAVEETSFAGEARTVSTFSAGASAANSGSVSVARSICSPEKKETCKFSDGREKLMERNAPVLE